MGEASGKLLQGGMLLSGGDEHQDAGFAGDDAEQRRTKLLEDVVDGGNDDSHVIGSEGRLGRDGLGLVNPMADTVNEKASVSMKPKSDEEVHPGAGRPAKADIGPEEIHDGHHGDEFLQVVCFCVKFVRFRSRNRDVLRRGGAD